MVLSPDEISVVPFEPILTNRFILYMDGFPTFGIRSVDGIGWEDTEISVKYINSYFKTRGFRTYNDINITLYDPIAPSMASSLVEWARLEHELASGRDGYSDFYFRDLTMNVVGPAGDVVREWVIKKAFPKSCKFGSFTYDNAEMTSIDLVLANSGIELNFG